MRASKLIPLIVSLFVLFAGTTTAQAAIDCSHRLVLMLVSPVPEPPTPGVLVGFSAVTVLAVMRYRRRHRIKSK